MVEKPRDQNRINPGKMLLKCRRWFLATNWCGSIGGQVVQSAGRWFNPSLDVAGVRKFSQETEKILVYVHLLWKGSENRIYVCTKKKRWTEVKLFYFLFWNAQRNMASFVYFYNYLPMTRLCMHIIGSYRKNRLFLKVQLVIYILFELFCIICRLTFLFHYIAYRRLQNTYRSQNIPRGARRLNISGESATRFLAVVRSPPPSSGPLIPREAMLRLRPSIIVGLWNR